MYMATSEKILAAVLVKETSKGQLHVYYVNKALHDSKFNYNQIKKLAYSLLMASRKVRQYFQSHHNIVLMDQPLREVLQKMTTSNRMVKWSIELNEYRVEFRPRQSIKAQTLANFMVKCFFLRSQSKSRGAIGKRKQQLLENTLS